MFIKHVGCYLCKFGFTPTFSKTRVLFASNNRLLIRSYSNNKDNDSNKIEDVLTDQFPPERIRNFSIIAHIDHGKSTLADRLLETTGTIAVSTDNRQILDKLQVERERGITVKAQTATMIYKLNGIKYLLNLIDTPGHVDFSFEVARSLQACQGVILLVDANQGVQAQTVANFYLAFARDLTIVPVLNKIDLKNANPALACEQLESLFEIDPATVLKISAKTGLGIDEVLQAVVEKIPPPTGDAKRPPKALLFDSWFDKYKGVGLLCALHDGKLTKKQQISLSHGEKTYEIREIGIMRPNPTPLDALYAGQVGYVYCNMRSVKEAAIGDTIFQTSKPVEPLPGFARAKPMVFSGVYPMDQSEHSQLKAALEKLLLNDPSVDSTVESSPALGNGWRLGFLGVLHMEVFSQRLEAEYGTEVILTAPHVPVQVKLKGVKSIKLYGNEYIMVNNPEKMPEANVIEEIKEPVVTGTIISPSVYTKEIHALCNECRGILKDSTELGSDRVMMTFRLPLCEIVVDFYDRLKACTSGYASFDYDDHQLELSSMAKIEFYLNGNHVEEMTTLCHESKARQVGRRISLKLKELVPRQQFAIAIQAKLGGTVLAREDIKAYRKDITGKLKFGGDVGRKNKLLQKQAEGKKRMKLVGQIQIPRETFIKVLQR